MEDYLAIDPRSPWNEPEFSEEEDERLKEQAADEQFEYNRNNN
jgi:hypothetical protein